MHLKKEELSAFRIFCILLGIFSVWFFNLLGQAFQKSNASYSDLYETIINLYSYMSYMIKNTPFHIEINKITALSMLFGAVTVGIVYIYYSYDAKNMKEGKEYGSARWGNKEDIKPFIDKVPSKNIILTATESLTMSGKMKNPKDNRNKNIMVIGGSGSGKTRFFVKPNLMQMHSNYVITDPKGSL